MDCKKVQYCSRNCQKINYQFHKRHCQYLKWIDTTEPPCEHESWGEWFKFQYSKMICLYVTAVMGQDYGLCEEFLEYVIKIQTLFHTRFTAWSQILMLLNFSYYAINRVI